MLNQIEMVSELIKAGMPQAQADAVIRVQSNFAENLVTREYMETRLTVLESRFETKLEKSLGDVKTTIVMWVSGILIAQGAAIVALVKLVGGQ